MFKILFSAFLFTAAGLLTTNTYQNFYQSPAEADTLTVLQAKDYYKDETGLINTILSRYHYKKFNLNDSLSSVIFDRYISSLDHSKSYFLSSDIEEFQRFRNTLDDSILDGNTEPAYRIFNLYVQRVNERFDYVEKILREGFDFTGDEYYEYDREDAPWPLTAGDANEIWRKRVKNDALNLKLTGKDWDSIVETLIKRYNSYRKAILQYNSEDVYQLILNSYTESIDPHTNYLSPVSSDDFRISMSLSLEGIGAQLRTEEDYTKVADIIPGGPAYKSGLLNRDDKITGVAQGEDGEMVDVIGWRITDVVQLIRGPKGSVVRLTIIPAGSGKNAVPREIKIIRDKVKLEEQAAKKSIIEVENEKNNYRIGVISIPAFYSDFEAQQQGDPDYRSTTRDVRKLINELRTEKIDGLIIDLRNDGGGSLNEAIDLTGLFIKQGPVVQVKSSDGNIDTGNDEDPAVVYDGPLAVLVNRFSASASEIFAGAIQDYERGIIIGEQTYGKGTVQNLIDLNRIAQLSDNELGQIKITVAKYYRINGGSTQHKGVIPDITLPPSIDPEEYGESTEKSALPWDQISAANFKPVDDLGEIIPLLTQKHKERIDNNPEFRNISEDLKEAEESRGHNSVSLNEEVRRKEKEEGEEREFIRENERRKVKGLKLLKKGETPSAEEKDEDIYLEEGGNILADLIAATTG